MVNEWALRPGKGPPRPGAAFMIEHMFYFVKEEVGGIIPTTNGTVVITLSWLLHNPRSLVELAWCPLVQLTKDREWKKILLIPPGLKSI